MAGIKKIIIILLLCAFHGCPAEFKLGVENISEKLLNNYIKKKLSIGLVTNQTGKDQKGNRTVDILLKKGFKVSALFAPEHGADGKLDLERDVKDGIDIKTGLGCRHCII